MRLWHLIFGVLLAAISLALWRDEVGRVALIVFVTGTAECALGTTAIMALFQTIGAIGNAERLSAYAEALGATLVVLIVATATMSGLLWVGAWLVVRAVA